MVIQADRLTEVDCTSSLGLATRLRTKVAAYERRFGFSSGELREALASGAVEDDLETCDWLIAWEALDALGRGGGPTRLE
jgi:hypothetical protein